MITLDLTIEQVNLILIALSKMPYETVQALIPNVQAQAQSQFDQQSAEE